MVCDKMSHLPLYKDLLRNGDKILSFIWGNDLSALPDGRYDIPGTSAYVSISDFTTRLPQEAKWESHNRYIDIHVPLCGEEIIQWVTTDHLDKSLGYDAQKDMEFYDDECSGSPVLVKTGYFFICLPHDAHKPLLSPDAPTTGRKAVIKAETP